MRRSFGLPLLREIFLWIFSSSVPGWMWDSEETWKIPPLWQAGGDTRFLLGTDAQGRDMLSAMLYGAGVSLSIGLLAVVIQGVLGIAIGLAAAVLGRIAPNRTARTFIRGASEMTAAALLIGFARTIEVVLSDGQIIDTIINSIAGLLQGGGAYVSVVGMLVVQSVCNFFIPSGSGQAYVTMPIMSPLATLTGVPQQCAVLAYQFGDGFTNMVVPTNALVMGTLALGRIPYTRWVRFILPLLLKLFGLAIVVLILAVRFGDAWGFNVGG